MHVVKAEMEPAVSKHDHNPPHPQVPDYEQTGDQKTPVSFSKNIETKTCLSKIESLNQNVVDSSVTSREKSELATRVYSDAENSEKLPSAVDSSSQISTCSETKGNAHVSSKSSYTNIASAISYLSYLSSSLKLNPDETEQSSSLSAGVESSWISENPFEVFPFSETYCKTSLYSNNTENVFFQKGKIYQPNIQESDKVELDTNVSTPTPDERHQWVLMNRKFIQKEGYRLGIKPGAFYSSSKGYFVEMLNGTNYEIIVTNENPVPCNVEVFIDNRATPAICFQLKPDKPMKFDGPTFCENKFVFLRSKDAPLRSGISVASTSNGVIEAVFTPQKIESIRERAVSEPIPFSRNVNSALHILGIKTEAQKLRSYTTSSANVERGIDITNFCQGATALRGEQTPKAFKKAEAMETDDTRQVTLRLRLVARTDDPSILSEEDICSMCPPSVEELLES